MNPRKYKEIALSLLLFACLAPPALALVTYRDENGTLHAVQSELEIPEQYRKNSKRLINKRSNRSVGTLPFTKTKDFYLVDVDIEGAGTFKFILDPKMYVSLVSPEIAYVLKKPSIEKATINTFNGAVKVKLIVMDKISVAGHEVRNFKVGVTDLDPELGASGRLGKSFLDQFKWSADEERGIITIFPPKK